MSWRNASSAALVAVAALAFAAGPLLVPGFDGYAPESFPRPQVDPPVQPAGWAFAIWGVIYLWLLAHAGFGLFARATAPDWQAMRAPLALSLAVGATWLPIAQVSPLAATVLIFVMLLGALTAMARAPMLDHWLARGPVALYAGWLTVASFVGLGLVLAGYGLAAPVTAAMICLVLAAALAVFMLSMLRNIAEYGIAVVWALAGVIVANWQSEPRVAGLALFAALIAGLMALRSATRR